VLQLVNSAHYGLTDYITSIVKAIIMLGINTIKSLAVSTAILNTMRKKAIISAIDMDGFWRHCLGVGITSRSIAKKCGVDPKQREEFFIAGMLHDIGKIVINDHFSVSYLSIIKASDSNRVSLWKKEHEFFDVDHTSVGRLIAKKWELSPGLAEAVIFHHTPLEAAEENRLLVTAVAAADLFCLENAIGFAGNRVGEPLSEESWNLLGLREEDLFDIEDTINEEIEKASIFLSIND
jgi:putative nucleotidyltransferase with HDIG domain